MATMERATTCGKCGGLRMVDRIGVEIDIVCLNCGLRQEAVARIAIIRSAIVDKVEDPDAPVHLRVELTCEYCKEMYMAWNRHTKYCSPDCKATANNDRRRAVGWKHA